VESWSTATTRSALESGDLPTWQRLVAALRHDPYGRTARQVEEVLDDHPHGISAALSEALARARRQLEANERAEVTRHMRLLMERSGLSQQEFASRIGVPAQTLDDYLQARGSPPASLMIRMRRLSDRFAETKPESGSEND
jgi:DNA-binding transcriptional regulator YiaG